MEQVVIWGTAAKAEFVYSNLVDCEMVGVIDEGDIAISEFNGIRVRRLESMVIANNELLIVCSASWQEILFKIKTKSSIDLDNVLIADPAFYSSPEAFSFSKLHALLNISANKQFEEWINLSCAERGTKILTDTISRHDINNRKYPISCYMGNRYEMNEAATIFDALFEKYNLVVDFTNCFGTKTRVHTGTNMSQLFEYNYPGDAYPLVSYIFEHLINLKIVFDVGANEGALSCSLSQLAEEIHSFEPSYEVTKIAMTNIDLNNITNIVWNNCGVGKEECELTYYDYGLNISGHNSFINQEKENGTAKQYLVKIISIDDYCIQRGIEYIDLLKIDVEGFESQVIEGTKNMIIDGRVGIIVLEISPSVIKNELEEKEMIKFLADCGYIFVNLEGMRITPLDIFGIMTHQDILAIHSDKMGFFHI